MGLYVRSGWLDVEACARLRAAMDAGDVEAAEIYAGEFVVDERVRRTLNVSVDPAMVRFLERRLETVRAEVSEFFGVPLSAAEGPGFLRYLPGGFYRVHRDVGGAPGDAFPRRVSLVLFLTTEVRDARGSGLCSGGSLRLWGVDPGTEEAPLDIAPRMGTLVAFRSDRPHEVRPVTAGVRDVVVDWFY